MLGPSGYGKTTLLRHIARFYTPDAGKIWFDDEDVTRLPAHKRGTGMMFQSYALWSRSEEQPVLRNFSEEGNAEVLSVAIDFLRGVMRMVSEGLLSFGLAGPRNRGRAGF